MSSATPGAERTPPPSSAGSRARRWRRNHEVPELAELDEAQAAELVRRSAESFREQASLAAAQTVDQPVEGVEGGDEDDNDHSDDNANNVVVELDRRWTDPAPGEEELAELEAKRLAAEASAAAATERVIAQAIATGMTDPDEVPVVRRGLLRRKSGYYSPAPARPVIDPPAAERAQELTLPRKVRREVERATREMTEAAESAHAGREAAERAAASHAEQTARAEAAAAQSAKAREAAEQAARAQAAQARTEAARRMTAEQLASETVEQMAVANAERLRVEQEARRHAEAAEAAHAARVEAEQAALRATLEREAAEARAQLLAASLEEARAALLEQTRASLAAESALGATAEPIAEPVAEPVAEPAAVAKPAPEAAAKPAPAPEPRIQPAGVPDVVEFRSPSSSAVLTVLLGLGALAAAGFAVYEAYLDRLTSTPGMVAVASTLVLVVIVGRARGVTARVWLEHGVLHVEGHDSQHRFDLTSPNTKVQMIGEPGKRRWKVLFLRKAMAPFEVDADLVDPHEFVRALRPWRPGL